jgi:hypothetical protein
VIIAFGWLVSWLVGGVLFVLATAVSSGPVSGLMIIFGILLAGGIGGGVTFRQYLQAQR